MWWSLISLQMQSLAQPPQCWPRPLLPMQQEQRRAHHQLRLTG